MILVRAFVKVYHVHPVLNDARLVLLIDEPFDDMDTSSNIGRFARLGNPTAECHCSISCSFI